MNIDSYSSKNIKPKISGASKTSIIIPCHNYGEYLGWSILSALHQSSPPKEIIVVNDSSKDQTAEVAAQFDNLIKYYYVNYNCAQKTRNFSISKASSEYILFLDADDFLNNYALETLETELNNNPKLKLVYSSSYRFGPSKLMLENKFKPYVKAENFSLDKLQKYNYIPMPSLFRKTGFPGFDPNIQRFQDWDAWLSFLSSNSDAKYIDLPLFHQRFHGKNKTLNINFYSERFKVLSKHKRLKFFHQIKNKKKLKTNINNKIIILALDINLNNAQSLIELLNQKSSHIQKAVIQIKDAEIIKFIDNAIKPKSLNIQYEKDRTLDSLIEKLILHNNPAQSEWFIISNFLTQVNLTNIHTYKPISEPLIEYPRDFNWELGLYQKNYIALNKKASQLIFSLPEQPQYNVFRIIYNYFTSFWNKHIEWRFKN